MEDPKQQEQVEHVGDVEPEDETVDSEEEELDDDFDDEDDLDDEDVD